MQFLVKKEELSNTERVYSMYWTGFEWNADYIPAKNYKNKGSADRAAKILARHHKGNIKSVAWE